MKHVSVDVRLIHAYGVGSYLKQFLERICSRYDLTFLYSPQDEAFLKRYAPRRMIPLTSPPFSFQEQFELPRKIPSCDLFWAPLINVPLAPIRAKRRLTSIHDTYHLSHNPTIKAHILYNAATSLSDHVITLTQFSLGEIQKRCRLQPKRITIIPPILASRFHPVSKTDALRRKYRLPTRFLLTAGSGKPHKNLTRLSQAVPEGIELVKVGKGSSIGYVPDEELPALYSAATAFVFPSLYEGYGIPPLEAMACGCPVIVSNAASLPEVCGDAAEYVNPLDIVSIREGIERVINNPDRRAELRMKGFARVEAHSSERILETLVGVIDACCSRS